MSFTLADLTSLSIIVVVLWFLKAKELFKGELVYSDSVSKIIE